MADTPTAKLVIAGLPCGPFRLVRADEIPTDPGFTEARDGGVRLARMVPESDPWQYGRACAWQGYPEGAVTRFKLRVSEIAYDTIYQFALNDTINLCVYFDPDDPCLKDNCGPSSTIINTFATCLACTPVVWVQAINCLTHDAEAAWLRNNDPQFGPSTAAYYLSVDAGETPCVYFPTDAPTQVVDPDPTVQATVVSKFLNCDVCTGSWVQAVSCADDTPVDGFWLSVHDSQFSRTAAYILSNNAGLSECVHFPEDAPAQDGTPAPDDQATVVEQFDDCDSCNQPGYVQAKDCITAELLDAWAFTPTDVQIGGDPIKAYHVLIDDVVYCVNYVGPPQDTPGGTVRDTLDEKEDCDHCLPCNEDDGPSPDLLASVSYSMAYVGGGPGSCSGTAGGTLGFLGNESPGCCVWDGSFDFACGDGAQPQFHIQVHYCPRANTTSVTVTETSLGCVGTCSFTGGPSGSCTVSFSCTSGGASLSGTATVSLS